MRMEGEKMGHVPTSPLTQLRSVPTLLLTLVPRSGSEPQLLMTNWNQLAGMERLGMIGVGAPINSHFRRPLITPRHFPDSYLGFQKRTMIRQHQTLSSTWSFGSTGNQSPSLWSTSPLNERHGQLSSQNPHPHPVVRWDKCHQNDHHCE